MAGCAVSTECAVCAACVGGSMCSVAVCAVCTGCAVCAG